MKNRFQEMYMNQWAAISTPLYLLAAGACWSYDQRCDREQRNYARISKEEIDALYCRAASLGWDRGEGPWRRFCHDQRDSEEYKRISGALNTTT